MSAFAAHLLREAERWQPHSAAVAEALGSAAGQDARETRFTAGSSAVRASGALRQARAQAKRLSAHRRGDLP